MGLLRRYAAVLVAMTWIFLAGFSTTCSSASSVDYCQRCADGGDCSLAFRGGPGQFCGNWIDHSNERRPCCCPTSSVCQVSMYDCRCADSNTRVGYGPYPNRPVSWGLTWLWWLLAILFLAICCAPCCFLLAQRRRRDRLMQIPVNEYPTTPYYYAGDGRRGGGGMGAGAGAALGGTAGLLGGLVLGEALADAGDHNGFAGGDFGAGGGDYAGGGFAGDF